MTNSIDQATLELWNRAKTIYISTLQSETEKSEYSRYLSMISMVERKDSNLILHTTNSYAADFIRDNLGVKLKNCLLLAGDKEDLNLDFIFDGVNTPAIVIPEQPVTVKEENNKVSSFVSTMPLNKDYTFEEFVTGLSNSWAHAAAVGVAKDPGQKGYNPLFIHGGTGLGKTHLMQAIGNEVIKKHPSFSVCYLTAERFLNEYVNSLQNHTMNKFHDRYRNIDVLLVDDIQFMSRGKDFQQEFFNTFNALHQDGKQIVMTSDVAPKDLPGIEERLITRFEWGMVQEIETPSYETRLAILKKKAESLSVNISEDTLKFIANKIKSHVRAMEGALGKVQLLKQINPTAQLTDEVLNHLLKDFIEKEKTRKLITIQEIQLTVAKFYGITLNQILSSERTQNIVTPRQMAMYIARKFTSKSLPEIAGEFDKTHATIVHGVKSISKRLDVEIDLKEDLNKIISEFGYTMDDKIS